MKLTDCTRQQAGECADALRRLLDSEAYLGNNPIDFSNRDRCAIGDLLLACEDAERGTPAKTVKAAADDTDEFDIGGSD